MTNQFLSMITSIIVVGKSGEQKAVLVVGVSMINKLKLDVCCVWLKLLGVCLYAHAMCVFLWHTCLDLYECVCVSVFSCGIRVVFAYNYYTHLILFFAFLYPRNLLPGHVTKPFLASVTH